MKNLKTPNTQLVLFISCIIGSSLLINSCAKSNLDKTPENTIDAKPVKTSTASTKGVFCDYKNDSFNPSKSVNARSTVEWSCSNTARKIEANGIPDHATGVFPNPHNGNTIAAREISKNFPLNPQKTNKVTELGGPRGDIGFILNGIKIDAGTGGTCNDTGSECRMGGKRVGQWRIEALGQTDFNFGTDDNNAHVQPSGAYHYHGMPEGFIKKRGGDSPKMMLIGWAADGFPIYARYGYSAANDASSALKKITGSFKHVAKKNASRPSTDIYPLGTFQQDWEYVKGSGDLDECNGRTGVTPEFPQGIYHYYATENYPYFQRCVKGKAKARERRGPPPGERGDRRGPPRGDPDGNRKDPPSGERPPQ